jgi:Cof subfamily protein (haloacid dehalogenase superfamily)
MKRLECIATDLDGTLLNSACDISPQDMDTVRKLKKQGVKIILCTGRHHKAAWYYSSLLGLEEPLIAANGCCCYDPVKKIVLFDSPIPHPAAARVCHYVMENNLLYNIYTRNELMVNTPDFVTRYWEKAVVASPWGRAAIKFPLDPFDAEGYQITKITVYFRDAEEEKSLSKFLSKEHNVVFFVSGRGAIDINLPHISKLSAFKALLPSLKVSLEHTLALGDNLNDLELLEAAGCSAVPENGCDEAKKAAAFITADCNHDPLTYAVHNLFPMYL